MNKSILNRVLILFMLIIWFFVFKNVLKAFNGKKELEFVEIQKNEVVKFNIIKKDSFDLIKLDRDPFSGRIKPKAIVNTVKSNQHRIQTQVKKAKIKTSKPWPKIIYFGFVKKSETRNKIALLKLDNKLVRVKEKTFFNNEIKIVKVYKDSVVIKKDKEIKTFIRK